jgi:Rho GTPase-activating protein 21/23
VSEGNYSKRKHVFRLSSVQCDSNNESELMLQASNPVEMKDWVTSLRQVTRVKKDYSDQQQQDHSGLDSSNDDVLNSSYPQKSVKKYHFGSRSPSGQSPVFKSRKAPQNLLLPSNSSINRDGSDKETSSPKQKSWKSFVTNQFKKMHPSNDSTSSNESNTCFLSECTPSEEDIHVPLLIAKCTKIVETKGLNIVGIYRIPGNTAAISGLYETIKNHGFNEQTLNDAKWDDVNVVSSLLKLFIRSLTEPILPNNLYQNFIAADKISNEEQRFQELRSLLRKFPPHNYGTLKHLIAHLTKVSSNSSVNLMEPRNLGKFNVVI